jgi:hypothetical protein
VIQTIKLKQTRKNKKEEDIQKGLSRKERIPEGIGVLGFHIFRFFLLVFDYL